MLVESVRNECALVPSIQGQAARQEYGGAHQVTRNPDGGALVRWALSPVEPTLRRASFGLPKLAEDKAKGIVIAPHWPTQAWSSHFHGIAFRLSVLSPYEEGPPLLEGLHSLGESWGVVVAEQM